MRAGKEGKEREKKKRDEVYRTTRARARTMTCLFGLASERDVRQDACNENEQQQASSLFVSRSQGQEQQGGKNSSSPFSKEQRTGE